MEEKKKKKKKYDLKKTRLQQLDYARAEHPVTDFHRFPPFPCFYTPSYTKCLYLTTGSWGKAIRQRLSKEEDSIHKVANNQRRHSIQSTTLQSKTMTEHPAILKISRGLWDCAHIKDINGCKWTCDTLFLTKTQKTLSLTMKTQ